MTDEFGIVILADKTNLYLFTNVWDFHSACGIAHD